VNQKFPILGLLYSISIYRHPQHTATNCGDKIVALCRVLAVYTWPKRRSQGSSIPATSSAGPRFKSCPGNRKPEFLVVILCLRLQLTREYVKAEQDRILCILSYSLFTITLSICAV